MVRDDNAYHCHRMGRDASILSVALGAIVIVGASDVRAQDRVPCSPPMSGTRLAWVRGDGADSCSNASAIERRVIERLGRNPFTGLPSQSIELVVEHHTSGWTARLFARDPSGALIGTRELVHDGLECGPLEEAASLAIALAIDPEAALRVASSPPPSSSSPPPGATVETPSAPSPSPPPEPERRVRHVRHREPAVLPAAPVSASANAFFQAGLLPVPSIGAAVQGDVHLAGRFSVSSQAFFFPEVAAPDPNGGFSFGLTGASFAGCVDAWHGQRAALSGCLGFDLGAIHAVVRDPAPLEPGAQFWAAGQASARFEIGLFGPVSLVARVDGIVPFIRHRFRRTAAGETVFLAPPVALTAQLGLGLHFW
jgi:hypothetical protein